MGKRANPCRAQHGFTLLELLVVIVIIGLLAGIVVPRYFDTVDKSKAKVAHAQMDQFEKALEHSDGHAGGTGDAADTSLSSTTDFGRRT